MQRANISYPAFGFVYFRLEFFFLVFRNKCYFARNSSYANYLRRTMTQVPWKQMRPKCKSDWFGCVFSMFGINAIYWYELLTVLPWVSKQSDSYSPLLYYIHMMSGTFLYVNAMWSFWKVISTDTSTVGVMLPVTLKPGNYRTSVYNINY